MELDGRLSAVGWLYVTLLGTEADIQHVDDEFGGVKHLLYVYR